MWETQRAGVQYTLDTVVQELAWDPDKRFIQVETAFFWRWWQQQVTFTLSVSGCKLFMKRMRGLRCW